MKIIVKVKDVKIKMDDNTAEGFNRYDSRVGFVIEIIKSMSVEAVKLIKESKA
jgi:hypothetical protein